MSFIDIIFGIPLLWFTFKGFSKGLIIELSTLVALLLGIYIALHFSDFTANFLRQKLDFHSQYMNVISFTITFLCISIMVMILGKSLEKVINIIMLGFVNKLCGAIFGLIKMIIILSIIVLIISTLQIENSIFSKKQQDKSFIYPKIKKISSKIFPSSKFGIKFIDSIDEAINK